MNTQRLKQQLSWLVRGHDYARAVAADVAALRAEVETLRAEVEALREEVTRVSHETRASSGDLIERVDALNRRVEQAGS